MSARIINRDGDRASFTMLLTGGASPLIFAASISAHKGEDASPREPWPIFSQTRGSQGMVVAGICFALRVICLNRSTNSLLSTTGPINGK